jgi:hypothetical protein
MSPLGFGSLKDFEAPVRYAVAGVLGVCTTIVLFILKVMIWGITVNVHITP